MGTSSSKTGIATFIDTAVRCGMKKVVCSPGSRNAPLVIAMDLHPQLETFVIHDERVAAFYALGMAMESGQPVGIVCTSGSAMLNYYPAVAEAYYQEIPLIVMTADRPREWVNHGDGQTIVQTGVYTNHILAEYQVAEEVHADLRTEFQKEIETGFATACGAWKGPVHFNFPITEPMYGITEWQHDVSELSLPQSEGLDKLDDELLDRWKKSERRMILCGQSDVNPHFLSLLSDLSEDSSLVVLVENTSNLVAPRFIHCIDRALSAMLPEEISGFQPDILISFGGAIISKRIKSFLRSTPNLYHCRVGSSLPEMDTFRALKLQLSAKPEDVLRLLLAENAPRNRSLFGSRWKQRDLLMQDAEAAFMQQLPFSDLSVFHALLDYLPEATVLHMGNSSVVRYCQLFQPLKEVIYRSNRGTSGIDGCLSTACGAALVRKDRLNLSIIGDVSFFYDSNALWTRYLGANLRIVLINNGGGGIFRIIDGPGNSSQLEKYFEAAPPGNAVHICAAFGLNYQSAHTMEELEDILPEFYQWEHAEGPALLEIFTPSGMNDTLLKQFFQQYSLLHK